jgi:high-affinity Fe2+/Pb2+ permease
VSVVCYSRLFALVLIQYGPRSAILIFIVALTMLRMDTARARWRRKLEAAFLEKSAKADGEGKSVKWVLFTLPFITVLREGLEAVVFIGGVSTISLAQKISFGYL